MECLACQAHKKKFDTKMQHRRSAQKNDFIYDKEDVILCIKCELEEVKNVILYSILQT